MTISLPCYVRMTVTAAGLVVGLNLAAAEPIGPAGLKKQITPAWVASQHDQIHLRRHFGQSDLRLDFGLNAKKAPGEGFSGYSDRANAERSALTALRQHSKVIDRWLASRADTGYLSIQAKVPGVAGRFKAPGTVAAPAPAARLILRKDATSRIGFSIVTSYPARNKPGNRFGRR